MKLFLTTFLTFIFCFQKADAQEFGGNRSSIRWRQINTDTARVVFPLGLDSAARRVALVVHTAAAKNIMPLGQKLKKINIVLQPQTTVSNGYVGLGPFRSEFYMAPPADNFELGTLNWADQLAIHEYRHVQQYNNFNNGASKVLYRLLGEEGYAVAINAAVPDWFYEGDAVVQETILSQQGRGRMPAFLKAYPALWQAGKNYSWMKLRNGSYKDYIPNHYQLGYMMINFGLKNFGSDFWKSVTRDATSYKGLFYPFQKSIHEYSGIRYKEFTRQSFNYYKNIYKDVIDSGKQLISGITDHSVTSYFYPQAVSKDKTVYLKTSYSQRPAFYIAQDGTEHLLRIRDISIDEQFSYRNGKIVYAAFEKHPRWHWQQYSVIKILDVSTNRQKTLQHRTKYFSPDISTDGKTIVANHVSATGNSSMVLLNSENGKIIKQIAADSISYFSDPKFLPTGNIAAAIRLQNSKSFIGIIDINTNQVIPLTPPSYNTAGHVNVSGSDIYFTASQGLRDEIFSVNIYNKQIKKLKTSTFANYFPYAGYGKIGYSAFTAFGYRLQDLNNNDFLWEQMNENEFANTPAGIAPDKKYQSFGIIDSADHSDFHTTPYAKLTRPFNFHSWRPNYDDPIFDFTIYGNNILNTVQTRLFYQYNQNDKTNAAGASVVYGGLFPFISIGTKYTHDRYTIVSDKLKRWNQWDNYAGINIPLNWTGNRTNKFFDWGLTFFNRSDFNKGFYRDTFRTVKFNYLDHHLLWAQQVQRSVQDIFPRWGYNFQVQFRHAITYYSSWQFLAKGSLFMPGLYPANSFYITAAMQEAGAPDRIFANRFPFARGFNAIDSARLTGLTFNYHFPVAYPDLGFRNIFYLQRLRAGLFYDYTRIWGKTIPYKKALISAGSELFFDTKWWNQHPVTFGIRGGYLLTTDLITQKKKPFFEFILPVSLIPR